MTAYNCRRVRRQKRLDRLITLIRDAREDADREGPFLARPNTSREITQRCPGKRAFDLHPQDKWDIRKPLISASRRTSGRHARPAAGHATQSAGRRRWTLPKLPEMRAPVPLTPGLALAMVRRVPSRSGMSNREGSAAPSSRSVFDSAARRWVHSRALCHRFARVLAAGYAATVLAPS
jgi:hypothetical protein